MKKEEVKTEHVVEHHYDLEMYIDVSDAEQLEISTSISYPGEYCFHAFGHSLQDLMKEQMDYIGNPDDYTKEWIVEELQKVIDMVKAYEGKDETVD